MSRRKLARTVVLILLACVAFGGGDEYWPTTYPGTGAYRRVYSHAQYSYVSAQIYLPGGAEVSMVGSDTPYVYTGGWGDNGQTAVDAGFQYSPKFNNWALFLKAEGIAGAGDVGPRFKADQTVTIAFAVTPAGNSATLQITADGVDIHDQPIHRTLSVPDVPHWSTHNTLKRMTSIAQVGGDHFTDSSFIRGVRWSHVAIGTSAADAKPWEDEQTAGTENYPEHRVTASATPPNGEVNSIVLK